MAYGEFEDLAKRTTFDKVLWDKAFNIAKNPKYDEYQRGAALWFINFLIKKLQVVVLKMTLNKTNNFQMNFISQLLRNFKKEK